MALLVLIVGISFAEYKQETEVLFINARVGKFVANDIELAMTLDGEEVETPPEKNSLYQVTVNCDNATGNWNMEKWLAEIGEISSGKVKCQVDFSTPTPTLSDVTATSDKTSISLSYTASGVNANTTCKWGTSDEAYDNEVTGVTNTNCNITGLDYDTTYYYKVCVKNSAGEICKEGNIKTTQPLNIIKVGDYISMTPTATSYSIPYSVTGYNITQTINPSELNLWRVIKKNSDGSVDVLSEYVTSDSISLRGNLGKSTSLALNEKISNAFTIPRFVSSVRLPERQYLLDSSSYCSQIRYFDESDATDLVLVKEVYGSLVGKRKNGKSTAYMTSVIGRECSSYCSNGPGSSIVVRVDENGEIGPETLYLYACNSTDNKNNTYSASIGIRPILTISADVEISNGAGSTELPYILSIQ